MKSHPLASGLSRQLLAVLLLVVGLAVAALGLTAYYSERKALQEQIVHQLTSLADLKQQELQTWLQERSADVEFLAVNHLNQEHFSELFNPSVPEPRKAEFSAFLADNLRGLQRARTGYIEIAMVDTHGRVRVSTDRAAVGQPAANQALLIRALASPDGRAIQDIHLNPQTGRPEMVWAQRMLAVNVDTRAETTQPIGLIVAAVDVEKAIYPLLGPLSVLGDTAETLLTRREGAEVVFLSNLLFYNGAPLTLRIPITSKTGEPAIRSTRGESGVIEARDYRGVPVLAAYRPIGDRGWGFIVKQDQVQAFAPVRQLTLRIIGWAILVLFATGLLAMLLAGRMVRPLTQLAKATQRVAEGDLNVEICSERQDEIGALAHSFRAMVNALVERQQQATSLTRTLELLNSTPDFLDVFHLTASELQNHLGFACLFLFVYDAEAETFDLLVADPPLPGGTLPSFPVTQTPEVVAVLAGHLHFAEDLSALQGSPLDRVFDAEGIRSRIAIPLTVEEKVVGMIVIGWSAVAGYDLTRLSLLNQVAGALALALERYRLFGEVQQRADQLAQANVELQRADQLKDEFIRNITHELKTPITILSGFTEFLLYDDNHNLQADQVEMLTTIATQSQHLTRLVTNVVALDRISRQSEEKAPLPICELAEESLNDARRTIQVEGIDRYRFLLECSDSPAGQLMVLGNREQLVRAFANLLDNAVKFSPEGGDIRIAIQTVTSLLATPGQSDNRKDTFGALALPDPLQSWVQVAISDEGIGIPPEKFEAAWERFVQLDGSTTRRFGGTGLGLALVREIVEAHDGHAWIESAPGEGTTLFFVLPAAEMCPDSTQGFLAQPWVTQPALDTV